MVCKPIRELSSPTINTPNSFTLCSLGTEYQRNEECLIFPRPPPASPVPNRFLPRNHFRKNRSRMSPALQRHRHKQKKLPKNALQTPVTPKTALPLPKATTSALPTRESEKPIPDDLSALTPPLPLPPQRRPPGATSQFWHRCQN